MSRFGSETKVYVGELGSNPSQTELEEAFSHYGPLRNVWVARNPPGFAFVEFEDARDAKESIRALDGSRVCGHRVVVELSNGRKRNRSAPIGGGRDMMGSRGLPPRRPRFDPNDRCYECGERGHYAYNCHRRRSGRGRSASRSRSRSRSPRRSRSRDRRSRSRHRDRSDSRDKSRSRSRSRGRGGRSRSPSANGRRN